MDAVPDVVTFAGLDAAAWTALGTVATAIVAAFALYYAKRSLGIARETRDDDRERIAALEAREQQRDLAVRRAQASAVYVDGVEFRGNHFVATVHNASDRPIYAVVVGFREVTWEFDVTTGALIAGDIIATGEPSQVSTGPHEALQVAALARIERPNRFEAVTFFRDADGVDWWLNNFGHLQERTP